MPQITKRRKLIKVSVPTKRIQYFGKYAKRRVFHPLYEKLKSNNKLLAKALSKEKEESRLLFSENVALTAEIQDLIMAYNKRNTAILKIQEASEQTMEMLSAMSRSVANIISFCQEFTSFSNMNLQVSYNSAEREDGGGRGGAGQERGTKVEENKSWSIKSPIKGIVKPMISGYTITKPTINLSRVNMHQINNPSNLNTIEESTNENSDRLGNGRTCRLPERLNVLTPRTSGEKEQPLNRESYRYSRRMSRRLSKAETSRLSNRSVKRRSMQITEEVASPRSQLNDLSKLLQNSPTVNIRRLTLTEKNSLQNDENADTSRSSITHGTKDFEKMNLKVQLRPNESTDESTESVKRKEEKLNDVNVEAQFRNSNDVYNQDDPLEGPSWLFNESPCERTAKDKKMIAHGSTSCNSIQATTNYGTSDTNHLGNKEPTKNISANTTSFVTQRRGHIAKEVDDDFDVDDFTLMMYMRQPVHDIPFDINDLKLPVLEGSTVSSSVDNELDPEVTTTLRQIVQSSSAIPSVYNELLRDRLSSCFVKLPMISNNNVEDTAESLNTLTEQTEPPESGEFERTSMDSKNCWSPGASSKKKGKQKSKAKANKDPSCAKVVLQKLNDFNEPNDSKRSVDYPQVDNSSDSGSISTYASKRPRRQKAPTNFQEPTLKLRLKKKSRRT